MFKRPNSLLVLIIAVSLVLTGCSYSAAPVFQPKTQQKNNLGITTEKSVAAPERYVLAFVGDIMVHKWQISAASIPDKSYSFSGYFSEVDPYLKSANLTVGNLETTLSGVYEKYSGYPRFNAPEALADELVSAGFDVVTTANNHSFDRKENGVLKTIEHLNTSGLAHTGTFATKEEAEQILIADVDGLKVAIMSYTYGTNGLRVPEDKKYLVNRIDLDKIEADIEKARQEAELVVVCLHSGVEYQRFPGEKQESLIKEIANSGADMIIGTHPHVLQKIETIEGQYKGEPKEVFVAYSLGNFVSSYRSRYKDTGIILFTQILKHPDGTIEIEDYNYLPVWTHRYWKDNRTWYRVIPVEKGIKMSDEKDYYLSKEDVFKLKQAWQDTTKLFGEDNVLTIEVP